MCERVLADVEFGRLQARDLLQHLWTGPISNAPVNIVQGSKSVEVRPVGISKVQICCRIVLLAHTASIWLPACSDMECNVVMKLSTTSLLHDGYFSA